MLGPIFDAIWLCSEQSPPVAEHTDSWSPLSDHVSWTALEFLDVPSLGRCGVCCRHWHFLARNEWLWEKCYGRSFGAPSGPVSSWRLAFRTESDVAFHDLSPREAEKAPTAKILLLGEAGVGKSCLIYRFCRNTMADHLMRDYAPTVGVDFGLRNTAFGFDRVAVRLLVWDTAGMRRFNAINATFNRNADAILLCYNAAAGPASLDAVLDQWLERVAEPRADGSSAVVGLLGLQAENPTQTTDDHARAAVQSRLPHRAHDLIYTQCSSTRHQSVDDAFARVLRALVRGDRLKPPEPPRLPRAQRLDATRFSADVPSRHLRRAFLHHYRLGLTHGRHAPINVNAPQDALLRSSTYPAAAPPCTLL